MNDLINLSLEYDLIEYSKQRNIAFRNYKKFNHIEKYDKILNARYCKISRIKKRFVYLVSNYSFIYFCTFTFDNDYIDKCDRTKRDLIKFSLLSFDSDIKYIINVDYGSKKEREHYHGIIATNNTGNLRKHLKNVYPCLTSCDFVPCSCSDIKKVSKYINKLSNHCIKDSTKNKRILYNFKGYDNYKELGRYLYIIDSYNLGL